MQNIMLSHIQWNTYYYPCAVNLIDYTPLSAAKDRYIFFKMSSWEMIERCFKWTENPITLPSGIFYLALKWEEKNGYFPLYESGCLHGDL